MTKDSACVKAFFLHGRFGTGAFPRASPELYVAAGRELPQVSVDGGNATSSCPARGTSRRPRASSGRWRCLKCRSSLRPHRRSQRRRPRPPLCRPQVPRDPPRSRPRRPRRAPRPLAVCRSASTAGWLCRRRNRRHAAQHRRARRTKRQLSDEPARGADLGREGVARGAAKDVFEPGTSVVQLGTAARRGRRRVLLARTLRVLETLSRRAAVTGERARPCFERSYAWHWRALPRSWTRAQLRGALRGADPAHRNDDALGAGAPDRRRPARRPPDLGRRRQDDPRLAAAAGASRARAAAPDRRRLRGPHLRARAHTRRPAVAAGGWTGWEWDRQGAVYLFDADSGELVRRIGGLSRRHRQSRLLEGRPPSRRRPARRCAGCGSCAPATTRRWRTTRSTATRSWAPISAPTACSRSAALDGQLRLYDR